MHVNPAKGTTCICLLTMLSTQHTIYPTCLHNTLNIQSVHSTPRHFPYLTSSHKPPKHKKSGSQNYCPNSPDSRKRLVFYTFSTLYFSTLDINTTHSTCVGTEAEYYMAKVIGQNYPHLLPESIAIFQFTPPDDFYPILAVFTPFLEEQPHLYTSAKLLLILFRH